MALLYFGGAKLALLLSIPPGNVAVFWPPSGIAVASFLVIGPSVWPGIWIAEFLANTNAYNFSGLFPSLLSVAAGACMATGMVVEALVAVRLIRKYATKNPFERLRNTIVFFLIAPLVGLIGSTVGTLSLLFGRLLSQHGVGRIWLTWFIGDTLGILLVTPTILTVHRYGWARLTRAKWIEFGLFVAAILAYAAGVFFYPYPGPQWSYAVQPLVLLLITWGAFRFSARDNSLAILLLTCVALVGIARNGGFVGLTSLDTHLLIQLFMGILALLSLSMSAITHQQRQTEQSLQTAKHEAEESMRHKTEFLNIAAHELRTPVAAFSLLVEFCKKQLQDGKRIESSTVDRLAYQTKLITRLVDDLLNVARLERGAVALQVEPANLGKVISGCVASFRQQFPNRQIAYQKCDTDPNELCFSFDALRIEQVLNNLIDNAIKYTPEDSSIEVTLDRRSDAVTISVIDHGPGIAQKQRSDIFSSFSRGSSDSAIRNAGLGLGLFVAQNLVRLHGGTMGFDSEEGRGSTFYFTLNKRGSPA